MQSIEFLMFDLDGTLVDSEALCNQAFVDLLPELGTRVSLEDLTRLNRGRKLAGILADLEDRFGMRLGADFEARYRRRVETLFSSELKPVEGVPDMLDALDLPKCVASSGPPEKIRQALEVCGLARHFLERIYSSYVVRSWKPDPGLYQHAMQDAGYAPDRCAVVEDSPVGIQAARAAGVRAFLYAPGSGTSDEGYGTAFGSMADLPDLIVRAGTVALG